VVEAPPAAGGGSECGRYGGGWWEEDGPKCGAIRTVGRVLTSIVSWILFGIVLFAKFWLNNFDFILGFF
jgi:hypothetical protein